MTQRDSYRQSGISRYAAVIAAMARALLDSRPRAPVVVRTPASAPVPPPKTTCAECGWRDAKAYEVSDGRRIAVCHTCATLEVPEPEPEPTLRDRVIAALRRTDEADMDEFAAMLGMSSQLERGRISACLNRALKRGEIASRGGKMARSYYVVRKG